MEEIILRFPHLNERIFNLLDNNSLEKSRKSDRYWNVYIAKQKFYIIRIIKRTVELFQDLGPEWNKVLVKSMTKTITDLQKAVQLFYEEHKAVCITRNISEYSRESNCTIYCSLKYPNKITPLHIAAYSGDLDLLKTILQRYQEYQKDEWGCTPLHFASHKGHLEMCQYIIDTFDDTNTKNGFGVTPLHEAARHGHLQMCEIFIQKFEDIHPATNAGQTPLHEAAICGHLKICEVLVENLVDKNPAADNSGWTPLHCAALYGHLEVCDFFMGITDNINPHTKSPYGYFPLYFAADNKHTDICELILKRLNDKNPQVNMAGLPYKDAIRLFPRPENQGYL